MGETFTMLARLATLVLIATLLAGCASTPGLYRVFGKGEVTYRGASWCLPFGLKRVLRRVAYHYGDVHVFSTFRSPWHNWRVGGASRSYHKTCRAADFTVRGADMRAVYAYVKRQRAVGGHKLYPKGRGGHIHIDNGARRSWR